MQTTFGCIGCGNMGAAILRGLAGRQGLTLMGLDADQHKAAALVEEIGMTVPPQGLRGMVEQADYILLAVKPNQMRQVLEEMAPRLRTGQVLVSIAAGVTLKQLKTYSSGACPVVRVMPNTPALVQEGVFALCFDDPMLKPQHKEYVLELFQSLGQVHELQEAYFDAFTAIVGSGPAYVLYFMEALVEGGVALGLHRDQATAMVKGLFKGTAKLALESDSHLSILREMVTSPGGTTIAGTSVLDSGAVRGRIIEAARAACERSKELG